MKTTLQEILNLNPCGQLGVESGWGKAINSLRITDLSTEVAPMDILKHAGIKDACWCLSVFEYKDYCLFLAEVAESVLHIFEAKYPEDRRVRDCIQAVIDYHAGLICKVELGAASFDAEAAATDAHASDDDYTTSDAAYAAYYSAYAAYDASYAASDTAYAAYDAYARYNKWQEIEQIYIKHFGSK